MTEEPVGKQEGSKGPPPLVPSLPENSSVKLIGLGGVGGRLAADLALLLSSLNVSARLVLIDGDRFEAANAARMMIPEYGNKARSCEPSWFGAAAGPGSPSWPSRSS